MAVGCVAPRPPSIHEQAFAEAVCRTHNVCSPWPNGAEATPNKQVCFYSLKLGRSLKLSRPVGVSSSSCFASTVFSLTSSDSSPTSVQLQQQQFCLMCVTANRQYRSKLVVFCLHRKATPANVIIMGYKQGSRLLLCRLQEQTGNNTRNCMYRPSSKCLFTWLRRKSLGFWT